MPTPAGSVTSTWMACRPTHETECCSENVHRFMPNSVTCMWLRGREGAIDAALYGPSAGEFDFPTSASGCISAWNPPGPGTTPFAPRRDGTRRLPEGGKARAISDDIEYLELIPYGCTELRLTVFPVVE